MTEEQRQHLLKELKKQQTAARKTLKHIESSKTKYNMILSELASLRATEEVRRYIELSNEEAKLRSLNSDLISEQQHNQKLIAENSAYCLAQILSKTYDPSNPETCEHDLWIHIGSRNNKGSFIPNENSKDFAHNEYMCIDCTEITKKGPSKWRKFEKTRLVIKGTTHQDSLIREEYLKLLIENDSEEAILKLVQKYGRR